MNTLDDPDCWTPSCIVCDKAVCKHCHHKMRVAQMGDQNLQPDENACHPTTCSCSYELISVTALRKYLHDEECDNTRYSTNGNPPLGPAIVFSDFFTEKPPPLMEEDKQELALKQQQESSKQIAECAICF